MPTKEGDNQPKYALGQIICTAFVILIGSILLVYLYPAQYSGDLDAYFTTFMETQFPKGNMKLILS